MKLAAFGAAVFTFWLAAVLQSAVAFRLDFWGIRPDFLLIVGLCWAAVSRPSGGAVSGFAAGALLGGIVGATTTLYVLTRTLTCFLLSLAGQTGIENSPRTTMILGFLGSLVCQVPLILLAPHNLVSEIRATILSAMVNGVLAIPLYSLLRRLFRPEAD